VIRRMLARLFAAAVAAPGLTPTAETFEVYNLDGIER
jgi:hypothetical protein